MDQSQAALTLKPEPQNIKLAIDMGATSLGWSLLSITDDGDPLGIIDMGVRIFSDGRDAKTKEPLAVARRIARGSRRRADRLLERKKNLMKLLIESGLMPKDEAARKALEQTDPWQARAMAASQEVSPETLGRALFHICQRRGFKSNRKADTKSNELSLMGEAIRDTESMLQNRTIGLALYEDKIKGLPQHLWPSLRARSVPTEIEDDKGKKSTKNKYDLYFSRKLYEQEASHILDTQSAFHPKLLTDQLKEAIFNTIFFQRPLKPVPLGTCRFIQRAPRCRKSDPAFQTYRIWQSLNNLDFTSLDGSHKSLTNDQRDIIFTALFKEKELTFKAIRKLLNLPSDHIFNLESDKNDKLLGHHTNKIMADDKRVGKAWYRLSEDSQRIILDHLETESDIEVLMEFLQAQFPSFSPEQLEEIANAPIESGTGSLSVKAIHLILPFMQENKMRYDEAVAAAGFHHSNQKTGEVLTELPYYAEIMEDVAIGASYAEKHKDFPEKFYGKISNPTVHIALNQLRKLVNAIIAKYGMPKYFAIELARELKSSKAEIDKAQTQNNKINKGIDEIIKTHRNNNDHEVKGWERLKIRLWQEQGNSPETRSCPFCQQVISLTDLLSDKIEVEHLLPFARSYDDRRGNKVVAHLACNRNKGDRSPYEFLQNQPEKLEAMLRFADSLAKDKKWRFAKDAWQQWEKKGGDAIARLLNDTKYMSRVARRYLEALTPERGIGSNRVITTPGGMTALLRHQWGLNSLLGDEDDKKERGDHRHHALDAVVIGCTSRGVIKHISDTVGKYEKELEKSGASFDNKELYDQRKKRLHDFPPPFADFRSILEINLAKIHISFKPDHGNAQRAIRQHPPKTIGQLHEATAYGFAGEGVKKGTNFYVTRKPLSGMSSLKNIMEIRDDSIRNRLLDYLDGLKEDNKPEWSAALAKFGEEHKISRLRVLVEKSKDVMIAISRADGYSGKGDKEYKFYQGGSNYCAEIYCPDHGKLQGKWQCEIISTYDAHQPNFTPNWRKSFPNAKLIMRLQQHDMVEYWDEAQGKRIITRVRKLNNTANPQIVLVNPLHAKLGNNDGYTASANQLQLKQALKVAVDILGRVHKPQLA